MTNIKEHLDNMSNLMEEIDNQLNIHPLAKIIKKNYTRCKYIENIIIDKYLEYHKTSSYPNEKRFWDWISRESVDEEDSLYWKIRRLVLTYEPNSYRRLNDIKYFLKIEYNNNMCKGHSFIRVVIHNITIKNGWDIADTPVLAETYLNPPKVSVYNHIHRPLLSSYYKT